MLSLKYLLNTQMEMESRQQLYKSKAQVRSLGWRCKCGRQCIYTLNHEFIGHFQLKSSIGTFSKLPPSAFSYTINPNFS